MRVMRFAAICCVFVAAPAPADDLDDLRVAEEDRCSPYDRKADYRYSASVERRIAERAGYRVDADGWLNRSFPSPYVNGAAVMSIRDTDIEHIVAAAEAHDSGLCAADRETRLAFASDLDNLTLALPSTNRYAKSDKDAAEWLPPDNVCWYAQAVIRVKRKYDLAVDPAERDALREALEDCR